MVGYRIYFDTENKKFTMDDYKSQVGNTYNDGTTHWNAGYNTAVEAVKDLNDHLKSDIKELKDDEDFIVQNCKECNNLYITTKRYADWFTERKLNIPCRCDLCRMRRKAQKRRSEEV